MTLHPLANGDNPCETEGGSLIQAADTGISNNDHERARTLEGLANHLAYVQHLDNVDGQVLGQISRPPQTESRCCTMWCLKAVISIMSMASTRILSS